MTDSRTHWETVYKTKKPDAVSWYQPSLGLSLQFLQETGLPREAVIIDVGGGASTFIDDLLLLHYSNISVLDISSQALEYSKTRLGLRANSVKWLNADITKVDLPASGIDFWHDRAVFHFLTDPADRRAYVERLMRAVRPGGHVIIATFAEDGPEKCSGLPVMRYQPETLRAELGDAFLLVEHEKAAHRTPLGTVQQFVYCRYSMTP